jgi:predicted transcriptional regulator
MYTTVKISAELKKKLEEMKMSDSETYEEVIEDLIEDRLSLNPQFIAEIERRREEAKKGNVTSLAELKRGRK